MNDDDWDAEEDGPCPNCERCTWNKGPDCGKAEHPHCEVCGHCSGRHNSAVFRAVGRTIIDSGVGCDVGLSTTSIFPTTKETPHA